MTSRSESLNRLIPALVAARTQFPVLKKESDNPHFRSHYADLAAVLDVCEPALAKNGLAVIQTTRWADGVLCLETTLTHVSGEWISGQYPIMADYQRPQLVGAGMTYARRYSYMAIVGVAPEDDDGETASGRGQAQAGRQPAPPANGNGHGKPRTDWGPRAKNAAEPRPAAPAPGPAPAAQADRPPTNGRALFAWARSLEDEHGRGLVQFLNDYGRRAGYSGRMVEWIRPQVTAAHEDAMQNWDLIYPEGGADPDPDDYGGDDGRFDDARES